MALNKNHSLKMIRSVAEHQRYGFCYSWNPKGCDMLICERLAFVDDGKIYLTKKGISALPEHNPIKPTLMASL